MQPIAKEPEIRTTRATAAIARLNRRADGSQYQMVMTGAGLFTVRELRDGVAVDLTPPLELDAFVRFVDGLGPQQPRRVSKLDAAFARQLGKKP